LKFNDQGKEIFPGKKDDLSSQESIKNMEILAEEVFGSDAKPQARVNPYNPAARNPANRVYPTSLQGQAATENISKDAKKFPPNSALVSFGGQKLKIYDDAKPPAVSDASQQKPPPSVSNAPMDKEDVEMAEPIIPADPLVRLTE
jgi:hypothetical protein